MQLSSGCALFPKTPSSGLLAILAEAMKDLNISPRAIGYGVWMVFLGQLSIGIVNLLQRRAGIVQMQRRLPGEIIRRFRENHTAAPGSCRSRAPSL